MRRIGVGSTLILAFLLALASAGAAQESAGSITGVVVITDSADRFVVPIRVFDTNGDLVLEQMTFPDGDFSLNDLPPGTYKLQFGSQWYSSKPDLNSADPVVVNAGAETSGIKVNFVAAEFGWIEGRVYDLVSGEPACVTIIETVRPATDGTYRIGLAPGPWKIDFQDNCDFKYADQWWNGKADEATASVIDVVAGVTVSDVDAAMALPVDGGGWISGVVTDAETAQTIAGICVTPYSAEGEIPPTPPNTYWPRTEADGKYRIGFLGEGVFRVQFSDCSPFVYQEKWWQTGNTFAGADPISVTLGEEVSGVDIALDLQPGAVRPPATTDPLPPDELPFTGQSSEDARLLAAAWLLIIVGVVTVYSSARRAA